MQVRLGADALFIDLIAASESIEAQSTHWSTLPEVGGGSFNSMSTIPMVSVHQR